MITKLMQTTFLDRDTRTICDLSEFPLPDDTPAYMVNRVNTPREVRGRGHASRLMRDVVLPKADAEQIILWLYIEPTGGLTYHELAAWYHRLGFRPKWFSKEVVLWVRYPGSDNGT